MTVRAGPGERVAAAGDRLASTWRRSGPVGRAALLGGGALGAALVGAFVFGAWHVLIGGLVRGNPRAAGFGVVLSAVSLGALAVLARIGDRALPEG